MTSAKGRRPAASTVVGIVLAGGASRRFGADKLAAELDGRPLVLHPIEAVRAVHGLERLIVVGPAPPSQPDWLAAVATAGIELVRDEEAFGGPLAGLARGLRRLPNGDIAIVVGGDMPHLDPAVLGDLVREIEGVPGVDVAFLVAGGESRPLPLALAVGPARKVANELLERGERSLRALLVALEGRDRAIACDPRSIADVDTPDDLAVLSSSS